MKRLASHLDLHCLHKHLCWSAELWYFTENKTLIQILNELSSVNFCGKRKIFYIRLLFFCDSSGQSFKPSPSEYMYIYKTVALIFPGFETQPKNKIPHLCRIQTTSSPLQLTILYVYSRTWLARTSLGPWKFVLDIGSSSHWGFITKQGQEANRYNL